MTITKTSVTFFLVTILAILMSNNSVVAASGPPNCKAQCVPGKYGLHECIYDCIVAGYDYGTCNPNPTGKCCCAYEGHDR
ncbi:hypothetical protein BRARA_E02308 [Brassica rapa]|uniref:Defensin-like domain-containing protein n=1 Tax=Brassica campestris TaxID=3711 RepID=A0A397ZCV5_BRACM|nr:hypothetical protein BRARA_E02308 [Brassica rapa]